MDKNFFSATKFIGSKFPFWVQGTGGNTSVKLKDANTELLLIKSTGVRLDYVDEKYGLSLLNLDKVRLKYNSHFLSIANETDYSDLIKSKDNLISYSDSQNLPSMESGFHISLKHKYVFHFHSLVTHFIFLEHLKNPKSLMDWFLAKTNLKVHLIRFCYPGLQLSRLIHDNSDYDVYILENHGVILNFASSDMLTSYIELEKSFCQDYGLINLYVYFNKSMTQIWSEFKNFKMPFKSYFPDALVFKKEITEFILDYDSVDKSYVPQKNIDGSKTNLLEIWVATQILYKTDQNLLSISEVHLDQIRNMPAELTRRKKMEQT